MSEVCSTTIPYGYNSEYTVDAYGNIVFPNAPKILSGCCATCQHLENISPRNEVYGCNFMG